MLKLKYLFTFDNHHKSNYIEFHESEEEEAKHIAHALAQSDKFELVTLQSNNIIIYDPLS